MDTGLRLIVERCIRIITSYIDEIPPDQISSMNEVYYNLIKAKHSLMKCINISDPNDFAARRLIKEYERLLNSILDKR